MKYYSVSTSTIVSHFWLGRHLSEIVPGQTFEMGVRRQAVGRLVRRLLFFRLPSRLLASASGARRRVHAYI